MIAETSSPLWVVILVAVISAVFGGGGMAAVIKARPEGAKIVVDAAKGAVVIQAGVIERLEKELEHAYELIEDLRKEVAGVPDLQRQNITLRRRVSELEGSVKRIENGGATIAGPPMEEGGADVSTK